MKSFLKTLPVITLSFLAACSEGGESSNDQSNMINQNEAIAADGSNINGIYTADMWPVNHNLHLKSLGMAGVQRDGDNFEAMIKLKYAPRGVVLRPAIYTARRCPNINDDLNKDAYIDIVEARAAIGKITIPFDSDLDSQESGSFSASGADGKYSYQQSASFDRMFSDLKQTDQNPSDQMVKIGVEEGLTFPGRIVLIQGLAQTAALPATVATADGMSAHESIPVACGVLWKVGEMPEALKN